MIPAPGYGCISVKALLTVKIIREKIKMLNEMKIITWPPWRGESATRRWTRMGDAKRTGSRQRREITLLRIRLLCPTKLVYALFDSRRCQERRTYAPVTGMGKLTRGSRAWNDCRGSISTLLSEYREFLYWRTRKYSSFSYVRD